MHLNRIVLPVRDVDAVATYYRTVLGLPVQIDGGTATVTVGRTRLGLRAAEEPVGSHHLAMTIPRHTFAAARSWLEGRARLLLELIERRDLPPGRSSTFSAQDLVCLSEVGIALPDVEQAVALLRRSARIETFGEPPSQDFAAVGDLHGLLILVRPGRAWLPTADRYAVTTPTTVDAAGPRTGTCTLGPGTTVRVLRSGADDA